MWRCVFAVILIPTLTAAQSPSAESGAHDSRTPASVSAPSTYRGYTFYDGLRRGRDEDVGVQLSVRGVVSTPKSAVSGIVPLTLELQPEQGLKFGKFQYPKGWNRKVSFRPHPIPVAQWPSVRFNLHADKDAALGTHTLKGKLAFQVISYDGSVLGPAEEMDVQIPVTVVEHDARVQKSSWPLPHTSPGMAVTLIVLSPILVPLGLMMYLVCGATGDRGCLD